MNIRNTEINAKKIKAVKDAIYTVVKGKHEKSQVCLPPLGSLGVAGYTGEHF